MANSEVRKPRPCTWAEAEQVMPGIEADWRQMLGQDGTCIPPLNVDYRLELADWDGKTIVCVIQVDHEGVWSSPPEWRCWKLGRWTHPFPMTNRLLSFLYLPYKYGDTDDK